MNGLLGVLIATTTITAAAAQGQGFVESKERLQVVGMGLHVAEDCKGRKADINGSDLVIVLSGTCSALEVTGNNNRVSATLDAGAPLNVYGADHRIEWTSPGEVAVEVVGPNNSVRRLAD